MKNYFINTLFENDMIYIVIDTNDKIAETLFPDGVKISGNRFMFRDKYSETKKKGILESAEKVRKEYSELFDKFYLDSKSRKEKIKDNYSLMKCMTDLTNEKGEYICVDYFRFIYSTLDLEYLGYPWGVSINYEINVQNKNVKEELKQLEFKLENYFNIVFN